MGKDWGQLSKVLSKGRKSYQIKQAGKSWQQSQSRERFEDEYSELEAAFIDRPTPGGYEGRSAPGQSKSTSVRRTRRDDFELESSSDERDWAYMYDFQIIDSDIRAGYAFPRGPGLPHSGVLASQRGNESQDHRGDMNVPGIRTVVSTHREHYWQERGSLFPSEEHRRGWSREHHNPLMRESRGITEHTTGREHETPRSIHRKEEYEGEKERGQSRPRGWTRMGQEEETHILPCYRVVGTGLGTPPEENPKPLEDMEEGRNMKGREARREGGEVSVCRYPLMASQTGKRFMRSFPIMQK